jgi:predicted glycosyltransferase
MTKILFQVQHLLGIGHLQRTAMVARATAARGLDVTVASGGMAIDHLDVGDARFHQLPALRAADASFSALLDEHGAEIDDDWRQRRCAETCRLFAEHNPAVLVVETFPFGRRQLAFELLPLVAAARAAGTIVVSSVRDILTSRKPARTEEAAAWAAEHFDHVLVHGDPGLVGFDDSFPAARKIAGKLAYTGYVAAAMGSSGKGTAGRGEVIVSAGGGAVGAPLLDAARAARSLSRHGGNRCWRLLAGANLDDNAFAALAIGAPEGVVVERARADFPTLLANCAVSVSQAGYNTVVDILQAKARAVLVPFARDGETEQALRARRLHALGRITYLDEDGLTPSRLAEAVDRALAAPTPAATEIAMDGAERSAALIAGWSDG